MSDILSKPSPIQRVPSKSDHPNDEPALLFPIKELQKLDRESAIRCQSLLGHGDCFGIWETPTSMVGRNLNSVHRRIDFRKRLGNFLCDVQHPPATLETNIEEAILQMTRYALLLRIGPSGLNRLKGRSLDVTTIGFTLYAILPLIFSKSIVRNIELGSRDTTGLVSSLTPNDVKQLNSNRYVAIEFQRMRMLANRELWVDAPPSNVISTTTNPKGDAVIPPGQCISIPHPPIPDEYLAVMGPRILWLVLDLGPNLITIFEAIPELFSDVKIIQGVKNKRSRNLRLRRYLSRFEWRDRNGKELTAPPFQIKTGSGNYGTDPQEWPPRGLEHMNTLAVMLQSSHLWIALLAMGGRISEISTLERNCVEWAIDGKPYANGKTFKLSSNLAGTGRDWPAPEVLVESLAQQVRLVKAWEMITSPLIIKSEGEGNTQVKERKYLWASLGGGRANPNDELNEFSQPLQLLAIRIGLNPKPGGKNLHPYRFRKTIARLAAIAIVDSPRVLMQLLGHKDITMTLGYMLTDKSLQVEINQVAQELRIMQCQGVIEDIHTSLHTRDIPKHGGHGGGGAPFLQEAVIAHEKELHMSGQEWGVNSSYELSVILTGNGQYFRMTKPGVICLKESRDAATCSCDSTCVNRIEDKTARRDVRQIIPILIEEGKRALSENLLLLVADKVQQINEEVLRFDDIKAEFHNNPDLTLLREAVA